MKNCIKAIFIIIGTIIGAGFASGQEIYSFFNVYGENGILGIVISSIILGFVIYYTLKVTNRLNLGKYSSLLEKTKLPKKMTNAMNIVINIFLLVSFYIMVSGFVAYFKQEFNIPNIITSIIILIICYVTFMKNIEGIAKANTIIIPVLIVIILFLGHKVNLFYVMKNIDLENIKLNGNWIIKSIEYASYNSILLIPILINLKKYSKNNEKKISIVSACIFFALAIITYFTMFKFKEIANIEIPLVYIASEFGNVFKNIYGMVVILAIYTTMISSGYAFLQENSKDRNRYRILARVICISAIFVSTLSFSNLVKLTYPIFGIVGLFQLVILFSRTAKNYL